MNKIQSLIIGVLVIAALGWVLSSHFSKKTSQSLPGLYNKTDPSNSADKETTSMISPTANADLGNTNKSFFLTILEPQDNTIVTVSTITIKGKTLPDAEVFVNDKQLLADKQGDFNVPIELGAGVNEIQIFANDPEGNMADKTLNITYNP